MLRAYYYFYYRLYRWNLKMWGSNDLPQYNAVLGVSMIQFLNFFTILVLIDMTIKGIDVTLFPRYLIIPVSLLILGVNYFLLMHKDKFKLIEQKFKDENSKKRRINGFLVFAYFSGSVLLYITLILFGSEIKS